jgi:hypothetical protein
MYKVKKSVITTMRPDMPKIAGIAKNARFPEGSVYLMGLFNIAV